MIWVVSQEYVVATVAKPAEVTMVSWVAPAVSVQLDVQDHHSWPWQTPTHTHSVLRFHCRKNQGPIPNSKGGQAPSLGQPPPPRAVNPEGSVYFMWGSHHHTHYYGSVKGVRQGQRRKRGNGKKRKEEKRKEEGKVEARYIPYVHLCIYVYIQCKYIIHAYTYSLS